MAKNVLATKCHLWLHTYCHRVGARDEQRDRFCASCAAPFDLSSRIQIRPELVPRHSRDALDFEHPQGWDLLPLPDSLFRDAQRSGELHKTAGGVDGSFEWRV